MYIRVRWGGIQSPGVEECDHSIIPGDWDKPLKLWGIIWQWPHTKPSPTNKQTNKQNQQTYMSIGSILGEGRGKLGGGGHFYLIFYAQCPKGVSVFEIARPEAPIDTANDS
jgi:hypothetical protein